MKFLVVGHLCLDVIHPADGPEIQCYGGIYYAVATLATLLGPGDRVVPVFGVSGEDHEPLMQDLAQFQNVDTSGIFRFDQPTNRVHLTYHNAETRIECSRHISAPIPFERIRPFLAADGILINMISGSDLTIDTLDQVRMAVRSHDIPLHFDYHSLTLGVHEDNVRFRRPVADWRRWAFMCDSVQLNEEEIGGLSPDRLSEQQVAGHLLTLGVKGVVVTRGERGATLYQNQRNKVNRIDIEGLKTERPADATGCGDVFGAAFLLSYVRDRDMASAARTANRIAARKARFSGISRMHELKPAAVEHQEQSADNQPGRSS